MKFSLSTLAALLIIALLIVAIVALLSPDWNNSAVHGVKAFYEYTVTH